ncbi:MAG: glycosyltransferase, partial [Chitinophagales bacterium]|nr:glycosyltransferase [Chitinophagales bacterium]
MYSYLIFPWTLQVLTKNKSSKNIEPSSIAIKKVSVVLAVYNEEKVIREKIESFLSLNYPAGNIEFIIGSDGSTDTTEIIIEEYINQYPRIQLVKFG